MIYGCFYGVSTFYSVYVENPKLGNFQVSFDRLSACLQHALFSVPLFSGAYAKRGSLRSFILCGSGIALLAITFVYALLPETMRFSRASILIGWCSASFVGLVLRMGCTNGTVHNRK